MKRAALTNKSEKTGKKERLIQRIKKARQMKITAVIERDLYMSDILALEQRYSFAQRTLSHKQNVMSCIENKEQIEELTDQSNKNTYIIDAQRKEVGYTYQLLQNRNVDEVLQQECGTIEETKSPLSYTNLEGYASDMSVIDETLARELDINIDDTDTMLSQLDKSVKSCEQTHQSIEEYQLLCQIQADEYPELEKNNEELTEEIGKIQNSIENMNASIQNKSNQLKELKINSDKMTSLANEELKTLESKKGKLQESVAQKASVIESFEEKIRYIDRISPFFKEKMTDKNFAQKVDFICQDIKEIPLDKNEQDVIKAEEDMKSIATDVTQIIELSKETSQINEECNERNMDWEKWKPKGEEYESSRILIALNRQGERRISFCRKFCKE